MNATEIVYLRAKRRGEPTRATWKGTWGQDPYNNFDGGTDEEIAQECKNNPNPDKCIQDRKIYNAWMNAKEQGYTGDLAKFKNQNTIGGIGKELFNYGLNLWQNRPSQAGSVTYNSNPPIPEKSNLGLWFGIGAGALLVGTAIWYFGFRKK